MSKSARGRETSGRIGFYRRKEECSNSKNWRRAIATLFRGSFQTDEDITVIDLDG